MNLPAQSRRNCATAADIGAHLRACDDSFVPPLSRRVEIVTYAAKIVARAERFEAWTDDGLVGLLAAYCNELELRVAFVTSVSVVPEWQGQGIASELLRSCIAYVRQGSIQRIELEVDLRNPAAALLYKKHGFAVVSTREHTQTLQLAI